MKAQKKLEETDSASPAAPKLVVLVGEAPEWQPELGALLAREGYATGRVPRLGDVLPLLDNGAMQALLVPSRPFAASDLLLLRRIREVSPRTAVVVVTKTPTDPDLKRAFESGATAFLSWPASNDAVRQAIDRGTLLAAPLPPMKKQAPPAPPPSKLDGRITIHNRLHAGHRYQAAMDEVFRVALRGLSGPWDVSVQPTGRTWFRIDVVAPDGASWSMSVPVHEDPRAEDLVDAVRTACVRHCRLRPENGEFRAGKAADGSAGARDRGPKAGSQGGGVTREPSPSAPEGTPK